jgi:hypothetical protein
MTYCLNIICSASSIWLTRHAIEARAIEKGPESCMSESSSLAERVLRGFFRVADSVGRSNAPQVIGPFVGMSCHPLLRLDPRAWRVLPRPDERARAKRPPSRDGACGNKVGMLLWPRLGTPPRRRGSVASCAWHTPLARRAWGTVTLRWCLDLGTLRSLIEGVCAN